MSGDLKIPSSFISIRTLVSFLVLLEIVSCRQPVKNFSASQPEMNDMADLNSYFVQKDRERIQNYIERKDLKMKESPSGLWYQVVKEGAGADFKDNDKVIIDYDCSLLDGTRCYSSQELGPKEVILGRTGIEAGLYEGLHLLKPGSEAIFIIPPFLAYGLLGDRKKIPSRAVIVYHLEARLK